jgi:hypothetical protein
MSLDRALLKRWAVSMVRDVVAFGIFWLIAFAFVRFGSRASSGWVASWAGFTLACVIGTAIAYKMRAMVTTLLLVGITVLAVSRFVIQPVFGEIAVRGLAYDVGSTTLAVMAMLVGFGFLITRFIISQARPNAHAE